MIHLEINCSQIISVQVKWYIILISNTKKTQECNGIQWQANWAYIVAIRYTSRCNSLHISFKWYSNYFKVSLAGCFSLNLLYSPFYIYKQHIQFNTITCKQKGKRVEPHVGCYHPFITVCSWSSMKVLICFCIIEQWKQNVTKQAYHVIGKREHKLNYWLLQTLQRCLYIIRSVYCNIKRNMTVNIILLIKLYHLNQYHVDPWNCISSFLKRKQCLNICIYVFYL